MAWRSAGSFGRSFASAAARAPSLRHRPAASLPRLRPPQSSMPRRRFASFSPSRNLGELGCTQSLLPLHSVAAAAQLTSHLTLNVRAFCELSNGRNGKDG
ncbi:PREDICTED: uncharacterized protein LOC104807235 isoform X2 [Tarenaya hassleriana]|uniref:uncharacterized protein LOC104807235 isoform X2 n=1 Tax=Tarenaya hassleriana TaxID=28532 RepID=UPI00053C7766|nr:PREDICTED: uncharacterized protein LOC104807235 isoform X2 [Tarenaya hassleriana]